MIRSYSNYPVNDYTFHLRPLNLPSMSFYYSPVLTPIHNGTAEYHAFYCVYSSPYFRDCIYHFRPVYQIRTYKRFPHIPTVNIKTFETATKHKTIHL